MKSIERVQKIESICIYSAFIKMKKKRKLLKFIRLPPNARRMASSICSLLRPQLAPFSRSSLTSFLKKIPVTLSMTKTCESNTFSLGVNERISMSHKKWKIFFWVWLRIFECFIFLLSRVGAVFYDLYQISCLSFWKKHSMVYLKLEMRFTIKELASFYFLFGWTNLKIST